MDFRQLRYFISVAEHLNFTQAAQHHYITQTAISQQIIALETQLGVKLFNRTNRSVQLTPAGKTFLRESRIMVARADEAIKLTRHAASGLVGNLKIGFLGPNEKPFMPTLIRQFRRKYPNIVFSLHQSGIDDIHEALEHRFLDVAFTLPFHLDKIAGLTWEAKIKRADLSGEPFVVIEREVAPGAFDAMIQDCVKSGFTPNIVAQSRFLETVLLLIESDVGISILPRFFELYATPNLRFIELEGENETMKLVVAHHVDNDNPTIPLFLEELKTVLEQLQPNK
ncbi:MAG: transcriptional regulator AlsR family [Firmicutes bacterium]|nr:transcriptional regulator AlsR family [Bacillota bacterium]